MEDFDTVMYRMLAAVNWRSNCQDGGQWLMHKLRVDPDRDFVTREPPELHALACLVHGALAALHALGAVYNYRRKNWGDVAAHIAAALYDAHSAHHHYRTEQIALRRLSSR